MSASQERSKSEPAARLRFRAPVLDGLIQELHEQISGGRHMPGSHVLVDEALTLETLERIRAAYVQEMETARQTVRHRHSVIARTQAEAQEIVAGAQRRIQVMLCEVGIKAAAEERAEEIREHASGVAERTRDAAWDHAIEMITRLEVELQTVARVVAEATQSVDSVRSSLGLTEPAQSEGNGRVDASEVRRE